MQKKKLQIKFYLKAEAIQIAKTTTETTKV